ncbi:MAG: hypothetical protein EPO61_02955 [Nitrospirae bacterium]|nr:MAG: hypothetical protein EPO61_02955 [Nitrospirota bacterium]
MTEQANRPDLTKLTLTLYWGNILLGLTLPWVVRIAHEVYTNHVSVISASQSLRRQLFAPGYNLFLVGAMNAVPFVIFALFVLLHLGRAHLCEPPTIPRRIGGVLGGAATLLGVSLWAHIGTVAYPDAQGALVYFFLPFYLLALIPLGYAVGRRLGRG